MGSTVDSTVVAPAATGTGCAARICIARGVEGGAGQVTVEVGQHPGVHHPAPQRRHERQHDHAGVPGGQHRALLEVAQGLVAARGVGVVVAVALQVVEQHVLAAPTCCSTCSASRLPARRYQACADSRAAARLRRHGCPCWRSCALWRRVMDPGGAGDLTRASSTRTSAADAHHGRGRGRARRQATVEPAPAVPRARAGCGGATADVPAPVAQEPQGRRCWPRAARAAQHLRGRRRQRARGLRRRRGCPDDWCCPDTGARSTSSR